uniref:Cnidarian restricted protein n=2 Tax=Clytia hemisphaerica TaxID=252671 RepID=A0A7M5U454_9CNID
MSGLGFSLWLLIVFNGYLSGVTAWWTRCDKDDCIMSNWSPWSRCSLATGVGVQNRNRTVEKIIDEKCKEKDCPKRVDRRKCCKSKCSNSHQPTMIPNSFTFSQIRSSLESNTDSTQSVKPSTQPIKPSPEASGGSSTRISTTVIGDSNEILSTTQYLDTKSMETTRILNPLQTSVLIKTSSMMTRETSITDPKTHQSNTIFPSEVASGILPVFVTETSSIIEASSQSFNQHSLAATHPISKTTKTISTKEYQHLHLSSTSIQTKLEASTRNFKTSTKNFETSTKNIETLAKNFETSTKNIESLLKDFETSTKNIETLTQNFETSTKNIEIKPTKSELLPVKTTIAMQRNCSMESLHFFIEIEDENEKREIVEETLRRIVCKDARDECNAEIAKAHCENPGPSFIKEYFLNETNEGFKVQIKSIFCGDAKQCLMETIFTSKRWKKSSTVRVCTMFGRCNKQGIDNGEVNSARQNRYKTFIILSSVFLVLTLTVGILFVLK